MKTRFNRKFLFAFGVMVGFATVFCIAAATDLGQLTLKNLTNRLLGLEERMLETEQRLAALEDRIRVFEGKPPPPPTPAIGLLSPKSGEEVGVNVVVEGIVRVNDLAGRFPVIGVHPLEGNLIWIQPFPKKVEKTSDGYKFRCRVYCGTTKEGIGETFEIYALLPKEGTLKEGDALDKLPKNVLVSPPVVVTRRARN